MRIAKVLRKDDPDVPVDQPCVRISVIKGMEDEPLVRVWTRNGLYSSSAILDAAACAEFEEAFRDAQEEAWG